MAHRIARVRLQRRLHHLVPAVGDCHAPARPRPHGARRRRVRGRRGVRLQPLPRGADRAPPGAVLLLDAARPARPPCGPARTSMGLPLRRRLLAGAGADERLHAALLPRCGRPLARLVRRPAASRAGRRARLVRGGRAGRGAVPSRVPAVPHALRHDALAVGDRVLQCRRFRDPREQLPSEVVGRNPEARPRGRVVSGLRHPRGRRGRPGVDPLDDAPLGRRASERRAGASPMGPPGRGKRGGDLGSAGARVLAVRRLPHQPRGRLDSGRQLEQAVQSHDRRGVSLPRVRRTGACLGRAPIAR